MRLLVSLAICAWLLAHAGAGGAPQNLGLLRQALEAPRELVGICGMVVK